MARRRRYDPKRSDHGGSKPHEFPSRTSSGLPVLIVGLLSILAGGQSGNAPLAAFGVVLALGPIVAATWVARRVRALECRRRAPDSAFEGEPVEVELELTHRGRGSQLFPQVGEAFAPEIHAQKHLVLPGRLRSGESSEQHYTGYCVLPRGIYTLGPAVVRIQDPFGWFERTKEIRTTNTLKVYPAVRAHAVDEAVGRCVEQVFDDRTQSRRGDSVEFYMVRDYQPGDSVRRVHWPSTARQGHPVVRDFTRVVAGDLVIVLDSCARANIGWGRNSSTEYSVRIAASLVSRSLGQHRRAQMLYGDGRSLHVESGSTPAHIEPFLETLVRFRPENSQPPLPELGGAIQRRFESRGTIVAMISPYLFVDPALVSMLRTWRRAGHRVIAVLYEAPDSGRENDPSATTAMRFGADLASDGIESVVVTCGDPILGLGSGAPVTDPVSVSGSERRA